MARNFMDLLRARWAQGKFLCVGLDSEISKVRPLVGSKIPADYPQVDASDEDSVFKFNRAIIDATAEFVGAFKPNRAFYAKLGVPGVMALGRTVDYVHRTHPEVVVIGDVKEADIDNTNKGYAQEAFDLYRFDAVTVHPYLGWEAMTPFLREKDKGVIVLVRTSNKGAGEFQDRLVGKPEGGTERFYQYVASQVTRCWNTNGNCAVVVGATYPSELQEVRKIVGNMPILIPGIGAQGGDVKATVEAGQDERGEGMIINASRSVIFASNDPNKFVEAAHAEAERLHNLINQYRKAA